MIWSICTNLGADPAATPGRGFTRLSAEMISRNQRVDGLIVWDMVCGTIGRPCPKVADDGGSRLTDIGPFRVPPACIYLFPDAVPSSATPPRSRNRSKPSSCCQPSTAASKAATQN